MDITIVIKGAFKHAGIIVGFSAAIIPALMCRFESIITTRDEFFHFWSQTISLIPGVLGKYIRKCYYKLCLRSCSLSADIGFLCVVNDRRTEIGDKVYIGMGTTLGYVRIGNGGLIGSRVSVINGGGQHAFGPDGHLSPFDRFATSCVTIGEDTWIGEGAIVMADVGRQCIVGAGSVVPRPVPNGCLVAGNPARLIRNLFPENE